MNKKKIKNPILPGFHPDPSIIRVNDDYYIATSTFEWFPGVEIHHSKDLIHWHLVSRVLTRQSQINMIGEPCSSGVWAPCLTYHQGVFYLVYSDLKTITGPYKDLKNYFVTTTDILGEWSDPIYLNGSGFDPSFFHDDDSHYILNMIWDHRKGSNHKGRFGGIIIQEYSTSEKKLIGPVTTIFKGTDLKVTEGPHLYKRDGYYYLLCAEGGTGPGHAVTLARSKNLVGPYEVCPYNPILTTRDHPDFFFQRCGHGDIVETQNGEWYMVHLCSRPSPVKKRSILGRETAIQKIMWDNDGWFRLQSGGRLPEKYVEAPDLTEISWPKLPERDNFTSKKLNIMYQTLRQPFDESILSLTERPGFLRLKGQYSLHSNFTQALIARRQQAFRYRARTCVEFLPSTYQQMAGLVALYDTENYYYLHVTWDEELGICLKIANCDDGTLHYCEEGSIPLKQKGIHLEINVDYEVLTYAYSCNGDQWHKIGSFYDASILSDEYGKAGHFTGAFIGICAQDISGASLFADFDYFEYNDFP